MCQQVGARGETTTTVEDDNSAGDGRILAGRLEFNVLARYSVNRMHAVKRECLLLFFVFQAEDGIRDLTVTGVQTCALPISSAHPQMVPARRYFPLSPPTAPSSRKARSRGWMVWRRRARLSHSWAEPGILRTRVRSEERRVGEEGRSRGSPYHLKKKKIQTDG